MGPRWKGDYLAEVTFGLMAGGLWVWFLEVERLNSGTIFEIAQVSEATMFCSRRMVLSCFIYMPSHPPIPISITISTTSS